MLFSFREQKWWGAKQGRLLEGRKCGKARVHHQLLHIEGQFEFIQQIPIPSSFNHGQKIHLCPSGGVGKIHWRRDGLPTPVFLGFPCGSAGKECACNVGNLGLIPGLGRFPGEGKGYPLQYSGLENSMGSQRVRYNWATFTFTLVKAYFHQWNISQIWDKQRP